MVWYNTAVKNRLRESQPIRAIFEEDKSGFQKISFFLIEEKLTFRRQQRTGNKGGYQEKIVLPNPASTTSLSGTY